jgi:hypothetical protein
MELVWRRPKRMQRNPVCHEFGSIAEGFHRHSAPQNPVTAVRRASAGFASVQY